MYRKSTRIHYHVVGNAVACASLIAVVWLCLFCFAQPARAEIAWSGNVSPTDPATWISGSYGTWAYIGDSGTGEVTVDGGSNIGSNSGRIGQWTGSVGLVTIDGIGSTWTNYSGLYVGAGMPDEHHEDEMEGWTEVGYGGNGTLKITNGGSVSNEEGYIGYGTDSTGLVTVDGANSTWANGWNLYVGYYTTGTLEIMNGGSVSNQNGYIGHGYHNGNMSPYLSTGLVRVDGVGSIWTNRYNLDVGYYTEGVLDITNGGLVSVADTLTISTAGNSCINMSTGGMLAINGAAASSLDDFMDLIGGMEAIHYWNGSDWANIAGATYGDDYTLNYLSGGDLDGYTMLTVGTVPEPSTIVMLIAGLIGFLVAWRHGG